jgi:hypothetical protein
LESMQGCLLVRLFKGRTELDISDEEGSLLSLPILEMCSEPDIRTGDAVGGCLSCTTRSPLALGICTYGAEFRSGQSGLSGF